VGVSFSIISLMRSKFAKLHGNNCVPIAHKCEHVWRSEGTYFYVARLLKAQAITSILKIVLFRIKHCNDVSNTHSRAIERRSVVKVECHPQVFTSLVPYTKNNPWEIQSQVFDYFPKKTPVDPRFFCTMLSRNPKELTVYVVIVLGRTTIVWRKRFSIAKVCRM
jgi:hypothetical protein